MPTFPEVEAASAAAAHIPENLRALRNHYGLADTNLADLTGIGRATIGNKLKGFTVCTAEEIGVFAAVFGVPINLLYQPRPAAVRWLLDHPEAEAKSPAYRFDPALKRGSATAQNAGSVWTLSGQVAGVCTENMFTVGDAVQLALQPVA